MVCGYFRKNIPCELLGICTLRISHIKDTSISVDQTRYDTSIVAKYVDKETVKASTKFYNTKLPSDMILTKYDTSTSD